MALGLAIIFGQMKVINMAHGEFSYHWRLYHLYAVNGNRKVLAGFLWIITFFMAILFSVLCWLFIVGYIVELGIVRHLYQRPLDTLLATWGLSLIMQQAFQVNIWRQRGKPDFA